MSILLAAVAITPLAGCGSRGATAILQQPENLFRVIFEDVEAPAIFAYSGEAATVRASEGFWLAIPGLASAERGRVTSPRTGRTVVVALFASEQGAALISEPAAEALGLDPEVSQLEVVALRSEARLLSPENGGVF